MNIRANKGYLGLAISLLCASSYANITPSTGTTSPTGENQQIQVLQQQIQAIRTQLQPMQRKLQRLSASLQQANKQKSQQATTISHLNTKVEKMQTQQEKLTNKGMALSRLSQRISKNAMHFDGRKGVYFEALPTTTLPLSLLVNRDKFTNGALTLGGSIEADLQRWSGDSIPTTKTLAYENGYGFNISTFNFDLYDQLNEWISIYGSLEGTDGDGGYKPSLNQAFFTLGNLQDSPLYLSAGKMYVPFGTYSAGGLISDSLTKTVFKPSTQTQILIGFHNAGLSSMLSVFNSGKDKTERYDTSKRADFAYSASYTIHANSAFSATAGGGYINDLSNLGEAFEESQRTANNLDMRLPAWDANAGITYKIFGMTAEYIHSIRSPENKPTKPSVWSTGVSVAPTLLGIPTTFDLGYSATINMENLPMSVTGNPTGDHTLAKGIKNAWLATVSRPFFNDVMILGLDVQYAKTYDNKKTTTTSLDGTIYF